MNRRTRRRLQRLAVLVAAAAACAAVLATGLAAVQHWPDATTHLRDDAFYEFTWACNLARGNGGTVSDGTSTSGVQPLWCALLAFMSSGQPAAIADLAVVAGMLCHLGGCLLLLWVGRGTPAGNCAALLWLANPLLLRECQNGQETAIACFAGLLLWTGRRTGDVRACLLLLFATFARAELWLLGALLALQRRDRPWWRRLLPPAIALLAWTLWNLSLGGSLLPDSATPMAFLAHATLPAEPGPGAWLRQEWWFLRPVLLGNPFGLVDAAGLGALVFVAVRPLVGSAWRMVPLLLVGLTALAGSSDLATPAFAALLLAIAPRPRDAAQRGGRARAHQLLLLALLAIVALHWAVRWYPRDYYAAPLAIGAVAAVQRLRRWPLLLLLVVTGAVMRWGLPLEPLGHQRAMATAAIAAPAIVPADARIGSFNAGILAFAHLQGPPPTVAVVDLDGVVDARAFGALRRGALGAWLDDHAIDWLVDRPGQFLRVAGDPSACGRWFGPGFAAERDLLELATCVVLPPAAAGDAAAAPGTGECSIFWRRGRGPAPAPPSASRQLRDLADGSAVVLWPAQAGQVLEVERREGGRAPLLAAARTVCHAFALPAARLGTGRLFLRGSGTVLLQLAP